MHEYKSGKRWVVLEISEIDRPLNFTVCYSEAREICLKAAEGHRKIGELRELIRMLMPEPRKPYQWGPAVPVMVKKVVHPLTAIERYSIEIMGRESKPVLFDDFIAAYSCFETFMQKGQNVNLYGCWRQHPLGVRKSLIYQYNTVYKSINQGIDLSEEVNINLIFFAREHRNSLHYQYFDCCLKKVNCLDKGKQLDTSLFYDFKICANEK